MLLMILTMMIIIGMALAMLKIIMTKSQYAERRE